MHLISRARVKLNQWVLPLLNLPKPLSLVGAGASITLCHQIAGTGARRVLLVTDEALLQLGLIAPIIQTLEQAGISVTVFSDIAPDPGYEMVLAGVQQLEQSKADAILAVGGGSPMDCAKAMLLSHANACHPEKLTKLWLYAAPRRKGLPFYAIPTTAGSGSEATIAAVVSDTQAQSKRTLIDPKLAPSMVALDPVLMTGLPPFITAPTGMDALTHAIEAYISTMANAETDELALLAAVGVLRHLPTAFSDGKNIQAREGMAIASYMAGLAFTRAGVGYVHAIAHQLGGLYHIPHGLINAIVMPYVLDYSKSHCVARLAQLARAAGLGQTRGSDALIADALIAHIREMNKTMGIPDKVKDLKRSDFDKIIERAFAEAHGTYGVPRYLDRHSATVLLTQLLPASQLTSNH